MEIVRLLDDKVLFLAEKMYEVLAGGVSYREFENTLKNELDNLGCEILQTVMEQLDQSFRESEERKKHWTIIRRDDSKSLLTPFGYMHYTRTYFRHKQTGNYRYLSDWEAGITSHSRVSTNLKAELVDASVVMSYENATVELSRYNPELKVSRQTVASCVKEFQVKKAPVPGEKRKVKRLYLEADEDHITIRDQKRGLAKLVYIHEGVIEKPRRHLKNLKSFSTARKSSDQFWYEIGEYVCEHYDLDSIEEIFLAADGGSWIKVGLDYICGAVFVLDKFHLNQRIQKATGHAKHLKKPIRKAIKEQDLDQVLKHFKTAHDLVEGASRKKTIYSAAKYIKNNWEGIKAQIKHPDVGCSAEGHISHVLAARMSSRPMWWSLTGADNMAQMRAVRANKESVKEHYLAKTDNIITIDELKEKAKAGLKEVAKRKLLGREDLHNVPLFKGKTNLTSVALKGINGIVAI